jgi:putative transposase
VVRELVRAARARGEDLTGPEGLLKLITKTVLESALEEELTEGLGFEKHRRPKNGGNIRNGTHPKTVLTEADGEVQVEVSAGPGRQGVVQVGRCRVRCWAAGVRAD